MNNEKTLFTDLIGSIYSETKTEKEIFPRPRGPEWPTDKMQYSFHAAKWNIEKQL